MYLITTKIFFLALGSILLGVALQNYFVTLFLFLTSLTIANIYYTLSIKNELIDFKYKILNSKKF